jgi:hypothetical protein
MTGVPERWSLAGQVAVVTGAARGRCRETVRLLVARGAQVVATDIRNDIDALASEQVATLQADAGDEKAVRATFTLALERFGRVDILVSNAGRTLNKLLAETSAADWTRSSRPMSSARSCTCVRRGGSWRRRAAARSWPSLRWSAPLACARLPPTLPRKGRSPNS